MYADISDTLQKPYSCRPLADVFVMRIKTVDSTPFMRAPRDMVGVACVHFISCPLTLLWGAGEGGGSEVRLVNRL